MKTWIRWVAGACAALGVAASVALAMSVQRGPTVPAREDVTPADIERALAIVRRNDPRRVPGPFMRRIDMTERDVNLLLHHTVQRRFPITTQLTLREQGAEVSASAPLRWGWWLNLRATLRQTGGLPVIDSVRIGHLPIPARWAEAAVLKLAAQYGIDAKAALTSGVVRRVSMHPGQARVVYVWLPDTAQRLLATLMPMEEQQRLLAYHEHLVLAHGSQEGMQPLSVAQVLPSLFRLAADRTSRGQDATSENRAAIVALALFANGRNIGKFLSPDAPARAAPPVSLTLNGRGDTALHFLVSAALAIDAGSPLADAVGLYKEMADSRGGSGFSFNDLAADRAGTRFGELAKASPSRFQAALVFSLQERDFMPEVEDLPEFMSEAEFTQRFGGVGAPPYKQVVDDIEQRIARRPLFQRMSS